MIGLNEKVLERRLRETIKQRGGLALKIWAVSFAGLPDRLVLMPGGRAFFAEIKTTGKKPDDRQKSVHKLLQSLGFSVAVVDSLGALRKFLEDIANVNS